MENKTLVIGATGHVGGHIVNQLGERGIKFLALSRRSRHTDGRDAQWVVGDLSGLAFHEPIEAQTVICTASLVLLEQALPRMFAVPPRRLVAFSTTGVLTKQNSSDDLERQQIVALANAEKRLIDTCKALSVDWTILRPTLVYEEGRDINVTRIARTIETLGFFPLYGRAKGLRQPVHAQDLAFGAIEASRMAATRNKIYEVPGRDTITYREMVNRIFDGMKRPRRAIPIPPVVWKLGYHTSRRFFPGTNIQMGLRMSKDHAFDCSAAQRDFNWSPRSFHPAFI